MAYYLFNIYLKKIIKWVYNYFFVFTKKIFNNNKKLLIIKYNNHFWFSSTILQFFYKNSTIEYKFINIKYFHCLFT